MKSYCDAKYCSPSTWSSISICPWQGRDKVLLVTGTSYISALPKTTTFRALVPRSDPCSECNCPASCELQIVSVRSHSLIMNPVSGCSWFTTSNHDILPFFLQLTYTHFLSPNPRSVTQAVLGACAKPVLVTLALKPISGWEQSQTQSPLTILYLKAPSNFSPRWQEPLLSMTTTT